MRYLSYKFNAYHKVDECYGTTFGKKLFQVLKYVYRIEVDQCIGNGRYTLQCTVFIFDMITHVEYTCHDNKEYTCFHSAHESLFDLKCFFADYDSCQQTENKV